MCAPIKFVLKVAACWFVLNALSLLGVYLWKRKDHALKHPDGEMHTWTTDEGGIVFSEVVGVVCFVVAIWSCAVLSVVSGLFLRRTMVVDDEERRPLLVKQ